VQNRCIAEGSAIGGRNGDALAGLSDPAPRS
jgi:hypothetical protein